jgi:hypothetical protein
MRERGVAAMAIEPPPAGRSVIVATTAKDAERDAGRADTDRESPATEPDEDRLAVVVAPDGERHDACRDEQQRRSDHGHSSDALPTEREAAVHVDALEDRVYAEFVAHVRGSQFTACSSQSQTSGSSKRASGL